MADGFAVVLEELESVRDILVSILHDYFDADGHLTRIRRSTGATRQQQGLTSSWLLNGADQIPAMGSSFGPATLSAANQLAEAHGRLQEMILRLLAEVEAKITDIETKLGTTVQTYHENEENLRLAINRVSEDQFF